MDSFRRFVESRSGQCLGEAGQSDNYSTWGFIDRKGDLIGPKKGETSHGDLARSLGFPQSGSAPIYAAISDGYVRYFTHRSGKYTSFVYGCPKSLTAIAKFLGNNILGGMIFIENMDTGLIEVSGTEHEVLLKLRAKRSVLEERWPQASASLRQIWREGGVLETGFILRSGRKRQCFDRGGHASLARRLGFDAKATHGNPAISAVEHGLVRYIYFEEQYIYEMTDSPAARQLVIRDLRIQGADKPVTVDFAAESGYFTHTFPDVSTAVLKLPHLPTPTKAGSKDWGL